MKTGARRSRHPARNQGRGAAAASVAGGGLREIMRRVLSNRWLARAAVGAAWAWSGWTGLVQLMHGGRYLNPDGVSYLDVGRKLLENWLLSGYSGYWSPLYAILAAAGAQAAEWAGRHRLAGVQAVNLMLFLAALAACVWMVRGLIGSCGGEPDGWRGVAVQISALSLFTVAVVRFGGLPLVTPDVLVAGITMAAVGLTARIAAGGWSRKNLFAAGVLLGVGYWAKAIFFPLWWWWLAVAVWLGWREPARRAIIWALAGWLMVAGPLVAQTSRTVGRLSFGEVGRLNVFWYVSRVAPFAFWEGREAGYGQPVHPLKKVEAGPGVYVFGDTFPEATYPLWYAPWYWYEGAKPKVTKAQLSNAIRENLRPLIGALKNRAVLTLMVVSFLAWLSRVCCRPRIAVLLVAAGPLALILVHLENRFLYGNLTAIWAAGAAGLVEAPQGRRRFLEVMLLSVSLAGALLAYRYALLTAVASAPYRIASIAEGLQQMGVNNGVRFCWIGSVSDGGELAWELRGRIVAQISDVAYVDWIRRHGLLPAEVESAFGQAGCQAAIAMLREKDPAPKGWSKVGRWPVYLLKLDKGASR